MMDFNVCHSYALDENNRLVNIKDVKEMNNTFVCPHCKSEMIKKCGQYKAWHFAHKNKLCDYDKYLHTIAEQRIKKWFNESEKVLIDIDSHTICPIATQCKFVSNRGYYDDSQDSCRHVISKQFDLKKWFGFAELEKTFVKDGNTFIADIFCHTRKEGGTPLFLEICVTHRCDKKKIESGIKIIEFDIQTEADIDAIINNPIRECEHIHFYNFHPKEDFGIRNEFCKSIKKFILLPSMKAYVDKDLSCHDIKKRRGIFEITIDYDDCIPCFVPDGGLYTVAMAVASKHFQFKDCSLCKYQKYNSFENIPICALYKKYGTRKYCRENNSAECSYFKKDETMIRQRNEAFNEYKKEHSVDIWIKQTKF